MLIGTLGYFRNWNLLLQEKKYKLEIYIISFKGLYIELLVLRYNFIHFGGVIVYYKITTIMDTIK